MGVWLMQVWETDRNQNILTVIMLSALAYILLGFGLKSWQVEEPTKSTVDSSMTCTSAIMIILYFWMYGGHSNIDTFGLPAISLAN